MKGQVVWGWPGWSLLHDLPHGRKRTHRTPNTFAKPGNPFRRRCWEPLTVPRSLDSPKGAILWPDNGSQSNSSIDQYPTPADGREQEMICVLARYLRTMENFQFERDWCL